MDDTEMHCLFFHRRRARGLLRFRNGLLRPIDRILSRMGPIGCSPKGPPSGKEELATHCRRADGFCASGPQASRQE